MIRLKNQFFIFLLISIVVSSCKGQQINRNLNKDSVRLAPISNYSKLIKTQGTDKYQNLHCSLQDKEGNLWFGTTGEGVYLFDGKEFTQFTVKDGLSNNKIWSILEDSSGKIWFGTDNGISQYDGKKFKKISLNVPIINNIVTNIPQSGIISVWSMHQDKTGTIWFGTSQDLYCYDGKSFSRFLDRKNITNEQQLNLKWIQCFLEDSSGNIWMGSGPIAEEGVIRFDGKSLFASKPNNDGWIRYMVKDQNGHIWFSGRQNGVFTYDGKTFKDFTEKINIGSAIYADNSGNIWFDGGEKINTIESNGGIWRYDGTTFKNFNENDGMSNNSVWTVLQDRQGIMWFGTRNCGLYSFDGRRYTSYSNDKL